MDNSVINELKQKYDLTKDSDVLALYAALQTGQYKLITPEERQFDDEVYELAMKVKEKQKKDGGEVSQKKVSKSVKATTSVYFTVIVALNFLFYSA